MLDHLRLETLVGLGAASLLGYILYGPKTTKTRAANAAGALAGLQNIGNSCFLNSVLQALASSPSVIRWLARPPADGASPAHRQLRTALTDVIQVVNRTHPEQHADPFTPAGVVACLLRLGWLIRRDEQDTHEMFYVLVSTLQEEPPPPPALSVGGLPAGDGPVEADTGEALVDWGALSARMRGDARDICGAGVTGGASGQRRRGEAGKTARGDVRTEEGRNGTMEGGTDAKVGVDVKSRPSEDGGALVCDTGAGAAPRENGDVTSVHATGDGRATRQSVDERGDAVEDSGAAGGTSGRTPPKTSPSNSPGNSNSQSLPSSSVNGEPSAAVNSPAVNGGSSSGGVFGRRRTRGIVHRVRGVDGLAWSGAVGQQRSPFTGTVSTQLVCQTCGHKCAVRWENFESLSLPLPAAPRPQALSLPALLGQFSAPETVHDVTCDACHRRGRFSKRTLVAKLPAALCLHLPRTTWQQSHGQAGKRGDHVSFSETLNMFPYTYAANITTATVGRPVSPPLDSGRHVYRLTAVIVHSGGASSGHFVTYRRQADPADSRWFYTSDTLVSRAAASEVFAAAAYMLFYDRVAPAASAAAAGVAVTASPVAAALLSPVGPAMLSPGPGSPLLPPGPGSPLLYAGPGPGSPLLYPGPGSGSPLLYPGPGTGSPLLPPRVAR